MAWIRQVRFRMASLMMLVAAFAAGTALFVKVRDISGDVALPLIKFDAPILFVSAIWLTAIALGALKSHSFCQTMLQGIVACLGFHSVMVLAENGLARPLLYWLQVNFALLVAGPLLARRIVKTRMERGPRRTWWKRTFEAFVFAFLNIALVSLGAFLEYVGAEVGGQFLK
jgi:hypothetical protein